MSLFNSNCNKDYFKLEELELIVREQYRIKPLEIIQKIEIILGDLVDPDKNRLIVHDFILYLFINKTVANLSLQNFLSYTKKYDSLESGLGGLFKPYLHNLDDNKIMSDIIYYIFDISCDKYYLYKSLESNYFSLIGADYDGVCPELFKPLGYFRGRMDYLLSRK